MIEMIVTRMDGRTANDVAVAIGRLVTARALVPGDRLPTVRALAAGIGVSSSTVSDAWRILAHHGTIVTARRNGTTIRASRATLTGRHWQVPAEPGTLDLDLSTGTPDTALLPPLGPELRRLHTSADLAITSYIDRPVLAELEHELRRDWPFEPEALTVVDGAMDALDRLVVSLVHLGDTVVVENPTFPPLLDMLELAGAEVIGVPLDHEGPDPTLFASALESGPVAVILQPRAHNPTGVTMSADRARQLAGAIRQAGAEGRPWIIEDDHSAGIITRPVASLGAHLPSTAVHIRSFSKSHGPDLRIAAVGGAADPVAAVVRRRQLGAAWTSRLIQHLLLSMLRSHSTAASVSAAADTYSERRRRLRAALERHDIAVVAGDGLNVWLPVRDEHRASVALAVSGIGVAPGHPFQVDGPMTLHQKDQALSDTSPHIRVSLGSARGDLDVLAAQLAKAATC